MLDTDMDQNKSREDPLPRLERERSPYGSGPRPPMANENRFSHEYLLSPDPLMSPKVKLNASQRSHSQIPPPPTADDSRRSSDHQRYDPKQPESMSPHFAYDGSHRSHSQAPPLPSMDDSRRSSDQSKYDQQHPVSRAQYPSRPSMDHSRRSSDQSKYDNKQPVRPPLAPLGRHASIADQSKYDPKQPPSRPPLAPLGRHASAVAYLGAPSPVEAGLPRPKVHHGSSDESDASHEGSSRKRDSYGPLSRQGPPKFSTPHFTEGTQRDEKRHSSRHPVTPPTPESTVTSKVPAVDRASLLSSEGLLRLTARLEDDSIGVRKASPRSSPMPSPRGSPASSPYPSPPGTPPNEARQYRPNPVANLKTDSPRSRPSSPLSSPSTPWTSGPGLYYNDGDRSGRPRPPLPKSRRTSPLPVPHAKEPDHMKVPSFEIREASPAVRQGRPLSDESLGPQRSKSRQRSDTVQSSSLKPAGIAGRRRSSTNTDAERPQLTVKTPSFLQPSDLKPPPSSRSRPSSPNPGTSGHKTKSSLGEPGSSATRSRSRSYVPDYITEPRTPASATTKSRPSFPPPMSAGSGPRPLAPLTAAPFPSQTQVVPLPKCPRPDAVAGYKDWYTLHHCTGFAICPECRSNVFGAGYDRYLKHRKPSSTDRKIQCDLNNPWIRLACVLSPNSNQPDVDILADLVDIDSMERQCPEYALANRDWYRLQEVDSERHIHDFNVCPHCVHSLELLFPTWRRIFYKTRSHHHDMNEIKQKCSLRSNRIRFGDYLDLLLESSKQAEISRNPPNTIPLTHLAKQMAQIGECPKDAMFPRKSWHIHPHIPEFTICQACYEKVVYPLVKTGSTIAAKIDRKPYKVDVPASCHLYSQRMRDIFMDSCEDDDLEHLKHAALKRHMLQQDTLAAIADAYEHPKDREAVDYGKEMWEEWQKKE